MEHRRVVPTPEGVPDLGEAVAGQFLGQRHGDLARTGDRTVAAFREEVGHPDIAKVVARWTGIPVGRMLQDEIQGILGLEDRMAERLIGQPQALDALTRRISTSRCAPGPIWSSPSA